MNMPFPKKELPVVGLRNVLFSASVLLYMNTKKFIFKNSFILMSKICILNTNPTETDK